MSSRNFTLLTKSGVTICENCFIQNDGLRRGLKQKICCYISGKPVLYYRKFCRVIEVIPINIREIARLSGVSIATVSRVINTPELVQQQTRELVQRVMQQQNYAPGHKRSAPRGRRAHALLFLFNEADYSFYERIPEGFEAVLAPRGYTMLHCPVFSDPERRAAQLEQLAGQGFGGVVFALRDFYPQELEAFERRQIPLVLARKYEGAPARCHRCYTDFSVGSFRMTEYLLSLGHRKIALLVERASFQFVASFCGGWKRAYFENGLRFDEAWIVHTPNTVDGGYQKARELLRGDDAPDAFFCASNEMAFGVLRAARDLGIQVPERLSIAGFTDSAVANLSEPPLTTVSQPIQQLGAVAARMLLDLIEAPDSPALQPQEIVLQPQLCIRRTCGARPTPQA